ITKPTDSRTDCIRLCRGCARFGNRQLPPSGLARPKMETSLQAYTQEPRLGYNQCCRSREQLEPHMKLPLTKLMPLFSAAAVAAMLTAVPLHAELTEKTKKVGGLTVHYKVVLPNGYDAAKAYPAILAFGGGPQNMNT